MNLNGSYPFGMRLATSCRRHPILMFILTLALAAAATVALLSQNNASVILYQAF